MRHKKLNKRFGRTISERKELMRSLARNMMIYTKITTTLPKAKQAKKLIEKLITLGKKSTLHSRRQIFSILRDKSLVAKVEKEIAVLFKERNGGYTRIIRLGNRHGDGAQMAILEFVEKIKMAESKPKKKEKAVAQKETAKQAEEKPKKEKIEKAAEKSEEKEAAKSKEEQKEAKKEELLKNKRGWVSRVKGMFDKKKE